MNAAVARLHLVLVGAARLAGRRGLTRLLLATFVFAILLGAHILPLPFLIAYGVLAAWLAGEAATARRPRVGQALILAAALLLSLAIGEPVFWVVNHAAPHLIGADDARPDPELGYGGRPGVKVRAERVTAGKALYDAAYTIDPGGFRVVPQPVPSPACTVVFFGDSFTFGEGLNDGETMPWQFAAAAGGRVDAYNLGFHGYGPHQMLRLLETGRARQYVGRSADLIVYQAILDHLRRAAGQDEWDIAGPRYELTGNAVTYRGPFHGEPYQTVHALLVRSQLIQFVNRLSGAQPPSPQEIPLFAAITAAARDAAERQFGSRFLVLFWDTGIGPGIAPEAARELTRRTMSALRHLDIEILPISRIIPDLDLHPAEYIISPRDWHPNARASRGIARYLAREAAPQYCPELRPTLPEPPLSGTSGNSGQDP